MRTLLQWREAGPVGELVLPLDVLRYTYMMKAVPSLLGHLRHMLRQPHVKVVGAVVMLKLEAGYIRITRRPA